MPLPHPQITLAALRKDKAYLAVGLSPATSTIRRQQEASQALAPSTSCRGLSSREAVPQHRFCYMSARAWINKHSKICPIFPQPRGFKPEYFWHLLWSFIILSSHALFHRCQVKNSSIYFWWVPTNKWNKAHLCLTQRVVPDEEITAG